MVSTLLDGDDTVLDHGRTDGDGRIPALGGDSRQAFHITDASAEHYVYPRHRLPIRPTEGADHVSGIILANNQYGKAETRGVRMYRDAPRHEIHDVNVSPCLRGDFSAPSLEGDQSRRASHGQPEADCLRL